MDFPANIGSRIGILGGTFDPVHLGHMAMAVNAKEKFSLDSVLFVPALNPPHKRTAVAGFSDRATMVDIAVSGSPGFFVSRIEGVRHGASYTIDTLRQIRAGVGEGPELFFILGEDAFVEIGTWKDFIVIPEFAHLIVIERDRPNGQILQNTIAFVFAGFVFDAVSRAWSSPGVAGKIFYLRMQPVAVSSSEIRARVASRACIGRLVPCAVGDYIERMGLYR